MHCHHPNTLAGGIHLALYFQIIRFHPLQKPKKRGHRRALKGQGLRQKRIDPVFGLGAKARQQVFAAIMAG